MLLPADPVRSLGARADLDGTHRPDKTRHSEALCLLASGRVREGKEETRGEGEQHRRRHQGQSKGSRISRREEQVREEDDWEVGEEMKPDGCLGDREQRWRDHCVERSPDVLKDALRHLNRVGSGDA